MVNESPALLTGYLMMEFPDASLLYNTPSTALNLELSKSVKPVRVLDWKHISPMYVTLSGIVTVRMPELFPKEPSILVTW